MRPASTSYAAFPSARATSQTRSTRWWTHKLRVRNVHERELAVPAEDVGALVDDPSRMWPHGLWPELRSDGIGFLRHEPLGHERGQSRSFRITGPNGFTGWHGWEVRANGATVLRHVVEADCRGWSRLAWPLVIRPMHDALHEDVLDAAESAVGGTPRRHEWSRWVRFLRSVLRRH